MKKSELKRRQPLRAKTPLRAKKPIRRVSDKQEIELALRRKLKRELIVEFGEQCMTCRDLYRDWRGITLSHKMPLSRGGKTTRENCPLECYPCHEKYEKHPELRESMYKHDVPEGFRLDPKESEAYLVIHPRETPEGVHIILMRT